MYNDNFNIIQLTQAMSYEPMWYIDRKKFKTLIDAVSFNNQQLLEVARLHVKYKHILHRTEIKQCFDYFLTKAECIDIDQLYDTTRVLYNERKNTI